MLPRNGESEMAEDDTAPTAPVAEEVYSDLHHRHEELRRHVRSMGIPVAMGWLGATAILVAMALGDGGFNTYSRFTESVMGIGLGMVGVGAIWCLVAFGRAYRLAVERIDLGAS
jgi:hypothetical protein